MKARLSRLSKVLTLAGMLAVSAVSTGCATTSRAYQTQRGLITQTTFQRTPVIHTVPRNIKGHELRRVTEQDSRYSIEGVVLHGKPMYEQENTYQQNGEFHTYFVLKKDHLKDIDDEAGETGKTSIESERLYIPTLVKSNSGEPLRTLPLNPTGRFAVKAKVTHYDTRGVQTGIFIETQDDMKINIKTMTLGGVEFYVPAVEPKELKRLAGFAKKRQPLPAFDFYMLPKEGTKRKQADNGEVTLWSRQGMFRPLMVTRKDYEARAPDEFMGPTVPEDDNPAQAASKPKK